MTRASSSRKRRIIATPRKTDKGWLVVLDCGHYKLMKNKPRSDHVALCKKCP